MSKTHDLKTWPEFFVHVVNGNKTFEMRFNDRDFQIGDILRLKEFDYCKMCMGKRHIPHVRGGELCLDECEDCSSAAEPATGGRYTGQVAMYTITFLLKNMIGLQEGYVIIGMKPYLIEGSALVQQPTEGTRQLISAALYRMGEWIAKGGRLVQGSAQAGSPQPNLLRIRMDMTIARPDDEEPKRIIQ